MRWGTRYIWQDLKISSKVKQNSARYVCIVSRMLLTRQDYIVQGNIYSLRSQSTEVTSRAATKAMTIETIKECKNKSSKMTIITIKSNTNDIFL